MHKTKEVALISGYNGFIGQHLASSLQERNIEIIAIPRLMLDPSALQAWLDFKNISPQYIFHFGAYGNHSMQKEADLTIQANYINTWNLLEVTKDIPYKAFINCSTSSIYGHQTEPMSEDTTPKPDTFYAASKAGAMYLARAYARQYDKPIVSIVPFSVFGEGEADWRFIPTICKNLITGDKMSFIGSPAHDWIYIDNLIDGILKVIDNAKKLQGEWVNIGMGGSWSNNAVIRQLEEISGERLSKVETYKELAHHSKMWVADNTKLKSLGWKPKVSFEEGLRRTWGYYQKKYLE